MKEDPNNESSQKNPERVGKKTDTVEGLTGEVMQCTKSIDITGFCPSRQHDKKRRVIVDFMQGTDGVQFHLIDCFPGRDYGSGFRYTMSDLKNPQSEIMAVFRRFSESFGFKTPDDLVKIIKGNAPKLDKKILLADFKKAYVLNGTSDGLLIDRMAHFGVELDKVWR